MTRLLKVVDSETDKVKKLIFDLGDDEKVEFSIINKDGSYRICAPSQTGCAMGCKICQLSDYKTKPRSLTLGEFRRCIDRVVSEIPRLSFLVSFMGSGEPLLYPGALVGNIMLCRQIYGQSVSFAFASMLPSHRALIEVAHTLLALGLKAKFHLSLHASSDETRKQLIPNSTQPIRSLIESTNWCRYTTGSEVEIHYSPIAGVNDSDADIHKLGELLTHTPIHVKFLRFSERPGCVLKRSEQFNPSILKDYGVTYEMYSAPGLDIGASCGQFLPEAYSK